MSTVALMEISPSATWRPLRVAPILGGGKEVVLEFCHCQAFWVRYAAVPCSTVAHKDKLLYFTLKQFELLFIEAEPDFTLKFLAFSDNVSPSQSNSLAVQPMPSPSRWNYRVFSDIFLLLQWPFFLRAVQNCLRRQHDVGTGDRGLCSPSTKVGEA